MKMRNKGKVHPSSSSSSSSSSSNTDSFPVLKLLPAAILTLISALSVQETEVFTYMITRSLKSANPSFQHKKKQCFDCDCFHCYTSFWVRWDSSPNRELIHQAIEAFEDHHSNGGHHFNKLNKRKDKTPRARKPEKVGVPAPENRVVVLEEEVKVEAPAPATVVRTHKGLARKVLPDFMGIFSSRLWSLWNPEV